MQKASNLNKTSRLGRDDKFYAKLKAFDNMFDICSCNCYDQKLEVELFEPDSIFLERLKIFFALKSI